jgi:hypothetical protein
VCSVSIQKNSGKPSTVVASPRRMKPTSVVYWLRFVIAIVAGFANNSLHIGQSNPAIGDPTLALLVGIGLGLAFYVLSILIVRHVFGFGDAELKGKHRDVTLGGGTFIVVWVMVSVLLNTLIGAS